VTIHSFLIPAGIPIAICSLDTIHSIRSDLLLKFSVNTVNSITAGGRNSTGLAFAWGRAVDVGSDEEADKEPTI
jgi:hypothetical protein